MNAPLAPIRLRVPRLADVPEPVRRKAKIKAVENRLVAEADRELTAATENYGQLFDEFLRTRRSRATAELYRWALAKWIAYCASAGVHPLLATPKDADLFAAQLEGAPASVNSTISGVSSFYGTLCKWGKVQRTPFIRVARRQESAGEKRIPTAAEVRKIMEGCG